MSTRENVIVALVSFLVVSPMLLVKHTIRIEPGQEMSIQATEGPDLSNLNNLFREITTTSKGISSPLRKSLLDLETVWPEALNSVKIVAPLKPTYYDAAAYYSVAQNKIILEPKPRVNSYLFWLFILSHELGHHVDFKLGDQAWNESVPVKKTNSVEVNAMLFTIATFAKVGISEERCKETFNTYFKLRSPGKYENKALPGWGNDFTSLVMRAYLQIGTIYEVILK